LTVLAASLWGCRPFFPSPFVDSAALSILTQRTTKLQDKTLCSLFHAKRKQLAPVSRLFMDNEMNIVWGLDKHTGRLHLDTWGQTHQPLLLNTSNSSSGLHSMPC
jgi:hypothetical protein